jgi:hypothetical protein
MPSTAQTRMPAVALHDAARGFSRKRPVPLPDLINEGVVMKTQFILATVAAVGLLVPATYASPIPQEREQKEAPKAQYHFRQEDAAKLRENYKGIEKVDRNSRPHFVAGGHLPDGWRARISPVPTTVIAELPAIPAGYVAGYIDGYAVIYDPNTGVIVDVIDLY